MPGLDQASFQVIGNSVRTICLLQHWEATSNARLLHLYSIFSSGQQITCVLIQCCSAGGEGERATYSPLFLKVSWFDPNDMITFCRVAPAACPEAKLQAEAALNHELQLVLLHRNAKQNSTNFLNWLPYSVHVFKMLFDKNCAFSEIK